MNPKHRLSSLTDAERSELVHLMSMSVAEIEKLAPAEVAGLLDWYAATKPTVAHPLPKYPQVVRAVSGSLWAVTKEALTEITDVICLQASGEHLSAEDIQARIGVGPPRRGAQMDGSVAVIPIYGVITPKVNLFTDIFGGASIDRLRTAFRDAMNDRDVSAVVFDIDSPGGFTPQITEFAREIRSSRGRKPVHAAANSLAGSAAYWLGAQADEFYVTPSGLVGSVGVYATHADTSALQEKMGVKITTFSAGEGKGEGNPWGPLSEDDQKAFQKRIDAAHKMFTDDVAKGRRMPVETVRSEFTGRVVIPEEAVAKGMVDGVATLEDVVGRVSLQAPARATGSAAATTLWVPGASWGAGQLTMTGDTTTIQAAESGLTFADEADAARAAADRIVNRATSLAEVERGHLTRAKRDALAACPEAFREAAKHIDDVLAATDPDKHRKEFERAAGRFALEGLRATTS